MSGLMCPRCRQLLVPGELAPWCLGGRYSCDTSRAIPVPRERPVEMPAPRHAAPAGDQPGPGRTGGADRSGPAGGLRAGDGELLAVLRREPAPLSRNEVMRRHGVGTGKADRLLEHLGWSKFASAGAR